MTDVVATLGRGEARQTLAEERPERVDRSTAGGADDGFEFGEAELDGVEVGAVGRQEPQGRAGRFNGGPHAVDLVGGEIVGDHDVAGLQRRDEDLFDVGQEAGPVHRTIQDPGGGEPRHPQRGDEGAAFPAAVGRVIGDPLAAGPRPYRRRRLVATPVSSRKTRRVGSRVGVVATQCARVAAMSGRSCSDARTVFLKGEAQLFHGPPDRGQTGGRAQGDLQVREGAVRLRVDQRRERG